MKKPPLYYFVIICGYTTSEISNYFVLWTFSPIFPIQSSWYSQHKPHRILDPLISIITLIPPPPSSLSSLSILLSVDHYYKRSLAFMIYSLAPLFLLLLCLEKLQPWSNPTPFTFYNCTKIAEISLEENTGHVDWWLASLCIYDNESQVDPQHWRAAILSVHSPVSHLSS